jgi:hypothetical protein
MITFFVNPCVKPVDKLVMLFLHGFLLFQQDFIVKEKLPNPAAISKKITMRK